MVLVRTVKGQCASFVNEFFISNSCLCPCELTFFFLEGRKERLNLFLHPLSWIFSSHRRSSHVACVLNPSKIKKKRRRTKESRQFKEGTSLEPARDQLQREGTREGSKLKAIAGIVDGDQLKRCSTARMRSLTNAEQTLSLRDGETTYFHEIVRNLHRRNVIDLLVQSAPKTEDF